MNTVTAQEAEKDFSRVLADVEAGNEVVIERGKQAIAKIIPIDPKPKPKRVPGLWKGKIDIGPEFFEPMSEEELRLWEGEGKEF